MLPEGGAPAALPGRPAGLQAQSIVALLLCLTHYFTPRCETGFDAFFTVLCLKITPIRAFGNSAGRGQACRVARGRRPNKVVKSLTAEVQNLKQEKQRSEDDKKKLLHQLESRTNEVERLTADVQKLQQEKQRSENELKNKLETEKKEVESLTAEVQKLQQEKQRSEKELKNQLDTRTNEGGTSSASQSSKGHVIKVEVVQWKNCICLKNTSRKDQELGGWTLKVQITDKEPISYTFEKSFKLSPGKTLTVGGPNYSSYNKTDLVWEDLKPWSNGDKLQVFLISNSGEIQHISVHSE
ncbi:lamin-B1-like [Micropterus dolomieu]|uniref:lamin-B1-like n=1 Tax=Micropterus dolomieu TaxID=147949 RepID=UPI001E8E536B|nr:lamin-B1-like [Micropterus dolomieu]